MFSVAKLLLPISLSHSFWFTVFAQLVKSLSIDSSVFCKIVEPAPGVDLEGLEVARECLTEVFKLDSASINDVKSDVLVDIFSSLEASEDQKIKSDLSHRGTSDNAPGSSSSNEVRSANSIEASKLVYFLPFFFSKFI